MRIIFEEHQYNAADVKEELKDISALQDVDKKISVSYVGYFYSTSIHDCVFILPKVLLKDENNNDVVANVYKNKEKTVPVTPEDIIKPEGQKKYLTKEYQKFIYEFAVWIYRALSVYRKQNSKSKSIYYRHLQQEGRGRRHQAYTFLDIILSLIRFNQENQDFFLFTIKNIHRGLNKINWTRTISRKTAFMQSNDVVYLNPINKKREIDFDEELFVIFFSILTYINDKYGFNAPINCQYDLIVGKQFKNYLNGFGKIRLRQIRYKYFSDRTLRLWELCYSFFDLAHPLMVNSEQKEYLLAKSFEHVFESMIDDLIGEKVIPKGLKEQLDGKRVDHMYAYDGLTISNEQDEQIYYIGDSKYYKIGHKLGRESIYKQYTYARNVIQWNIDLFIEDQRNSWTDEEKEDYKSDRDNFSKIRLLDDRKDNLTEGYNIIPNFFISAFVDEQRRYIAPKNIIGHKYYEDGKVVKDDNGEIVPQTHISYQFPDRLFDRDTLILSHYDVNFLYVIYLYARNKKNEKAAWKHIVRKLFRDEIRKVLEKKYDFYALKSKGNPLAGEQFIRDNFKELQGKLYRPYTDKDLYALALEKREGSSTKDSDSYLLLSDFFEIIDVNLGDNPKEELQQKVEAYQKAHPYTPTPNNWLPTYYIERFLDQNFVLGMYHDKEHWDWITGKNDKGTLIYNVRAGKKRRGSLSKTQLKNKKVRFAILYEEGKEKDNIYHVFRVHDTAVINEQRMREALYPRAPKGDYFIFRFDDEVNIGKIDISKLIDVKRKQGDYIEGAPIFLTGKELIKYRQSIDIVDTSGQMNEIQLELGL